MNVNKMQKLIDKYDYYDSLVTELTCSYFSDEVKLIFDSNKDDVIYLFKQCYKVLFEHETEYKKPGVIKRISINEMFYHIIRVLIEETLEGENYYICKIDMWPFKEEIWCKDIEILSKCK